MKVDAPIETPRVKPSGETENRLLESALSLFSKQGYEGTSIREIIEKARVTRPVLYYYFRNKEDLFSRVLEATFADMDKRFRGAIEGTEGCRERLKALTRASFQNVEENPDLVRMVVQVFFSPELRAIAKNAEGLTHARLRFIGAVMQEGLDSGELSGGDATTLALMYGGLIDIHAMARVRHSEARLTSQFADGLVDLFIDGVKNDGVSRVTLKSTFDFSTSPLNVEGNS